MLYETIRRRNSEKKGEMKRKCLETLRRNQRKARFLYGKKDEFRDRKSEEKAFRYRKRA